MFWYGPVTADRDALLILGNPRKLCARSVMRVHRIAQVCRNSGDSSDCLGICDARACARTLKGVRRAGLLLQRRCPRACARLRESTGNSKEANRQVETLRFEITNHSVPRTAVLG